MGTRRRAAVLRSRAAGLAALGLLIAGALTPATPAAAQPPDRVLAAAPNASRPRVGDVTPSPTSTGGGPKLTLGFRDRGRAGSLVNGFTCALSLSASRLAFGYDGFLEEVATVLYSGSIGCDTELQSVAGDVGLIDHTPPYNGETFSGRQVAGALVIGHNFGGSGSGQYVVQAHSYNGGRFIEPIMRLSLMAPIGMVWTSCDPGFGMIIYECTGEGSPFLFLVLGGTFQASGLTLACRDQNAGLDAEEARLNLPPGPSPFSTQSINTIAPIRDRVIAFKRDLCAVTSVTGANPFVQSQGDQLWTTAVNEAKNDARQNDDRPLYWARLSMTAAVQQWKPQSFALDPMNRQDLKRKLDWAARGINSSNFELNTAKKVFVTGFDPFDFTGTGLGVGNPSAAALLRLDRTLVNNAEVQVVVLPVRFHDFDAGIVETALTPHIQAGPQQATLITTVSQGRTGFDLEVWNGRKRGQPPPPDGTFPDNRGITQGTFTNPVEPLGLGSGEQFTRSTLPLDRMAVGSPFAVVQNTSVWEQTVLGTTPQQKPLGPTFCGTPLRVCHLAVAGSGGNFLSNEVAYRVTALRDRLAPAVQAGHIHTPFLNHPQLLPLPIDPTRRANIVRQYRQILEAAIGSPAGGACGEPQCTPVQAAYISHFTGLGCIGTESYYTPYFGFDGIRRSWDGRGMAGTILRTVTNRSWRGSDGQCHNDWPSGNPLSNFVTIYR